MCLATIVGWDGITASSGREAGLRATAAAPDAILLDWMIPEMDGLMMVQELQTNPATQAIPVILLTGDRQSAKAQSGGDWGIVAMIAKPFEPMAWASQMAD